MIVTIKETGESIDLTGAESFVETMDADNVLPAPLMIMKSFIAPLMADGS
ncbi:hypothetical protein [Desulfobacter curvatus]|nr:hypothetical protein [Desulfobacter curvatus]